MANISEGFLKRQVINRSIVITSYSIHYTKLYDHIHQRALKPANDGNSVFSYAGSTDIMSISEVSDYEKNKKGFYLTDLSGDFDINSVEKINVECRNFLTDRNNFV